MAVFTVKNIISEYNSVISSYIKSGYVLSPFTYNGSFTKSICYTDLVLLNDSSHILRVWLDEVDVRVGDSYSYTLSTVKKLGIVVRKYSNDSQRNKSCTHRTLWPDYGDIVYEKYFYDFNSYSHNVPVYTDSLEEVDKIFNKRNERLKPVSRSKCSNSIELSKLPDSFIDNIMDRINKIRGFKRADATCIKKVSLYKINSVNSRLRARVEVEFNSKRALIDLR
jgi:hypothetical protein